MIHQTVDAMAVRTRGRGFYEITREVQHPDVRRDFDRFFARLVPDGDPLFIHTMEGDDDMPAHVRTALTTVNLSIPIAEGRLALAPGRASTCGSTAAPHIRAVVVHLLGE